MCIKTLHAFILNLCASTVQIFYKTNTTLQWIAPMNSISCFIFYSVYYTTWVLNFESTLLKKNEGKVNLHEINIQRNDFFS